MKSNSNTAHCKELL